MVLKRQLKLIKKKFDEQKRGGDLNPGRHGARRPRTLKVKNQRKTKNADEDIRMNYPGPTDPSIHNDPYQTSPKQVYREDGRSGNVGNPDTELLSFYNGSGMRTNSISQAAQAGPSHFIPADIPLESLYRDEEDNESPYNELDERQMMDMEKDEDSTEL